MSIADLGSLGEFVGSIAVVVTLIFLVFQVRQNTSALQTQISQSYLDRWMESLDQIINNDTLAEVFARGPESLQELTSVEATVVTAYYHTLIRQTDFMHYQYRNGKLDQELWEQWRANGVETFRRNPIFRSMVGIPGQIYSPEMNELAKQYIIEATQTEPKKKSD